MLFLAAEPLTDKLVWEHGQRLHLPPAHLDLHADGDADPRGGQTEEEALGASSIRTTSIGQSATAGLQEAAQGDAAGRRIRHRAGDAAQQDRRRQVVAQALADAKPDAIFSSLFGPDLAKFVREGQQRGIFKGVEVFNLLAGEPEYLDPLKEEAPDGWYVTGYPWSEIKTPEHTKFLDAYQAKFKDYPRLGSVVGYATVMSAVETIKKAGSLDQDKLVAAASGLKVLTPFGEVTYRPIDHQSTMGAFVGRIGVKDGKGMHDRLALRRRQGRAAERRRGQEDAAGSSEAVLLRYPPPALRATSPV